jgi:hypothetical protein
VGRAGKASVRQPGRGVAAAEPRDRRAARIAGFDGAAQKLRAPDRDGALADPQGEQEDALARRFCEFT